MHVAALDNVDLQNTGCSWWNA